MQRQRLLSTCAVALATVYVAVGFGVFLSVADNYMKKSNIIPVAPTLGAVLFLGSIITFVLVKDFLYHHSSAGLGILFRSNMAVVFPFMFLAVLSLAQSVHPTAFWGEGRKWIYLQTYDFFIFLAAMMLPAFEFIRKRYRFFVVVGLLTILGSIWYEVENPGAFSSVPNRASGFPGNSNWGALCTVMICSMALSYKDGVNRIIDIVLLAATGLGVYFTLSRSGTINFVLLLCFFCAAGFFAAKDRAKNALTLIVSLGCLIGFFIIASMASDNSSDPGQSKAENRLSALASGEIQDDGSSADRLEAARVTLDKIEESPLLGHGTGYNRRLRQTPHNLYLKLWIDSGLLGVLTWLSLLAGGFWLFTSRKYRPGQALVLVTMFGGFFSHNILEQRTFLFLFGGAAAMSLYESAAYVIRLSNYSKLLSLLQARAVAESGTDYRQTANKLGLS